ncbi:hypothetical protein HPP92_004162, partial [Vanilla planifolia]
VELDGAAVFRILSLDPACQPAVSASSVAVRQRPIGNSARSSARPCDRQSARS